MRFFKSRNRKTDADGEALAERIAIAITSQQRHLADLLNAITVRWNRHVLIFCIISLMVLLGCYCLWLVIGVAF